jgi:competence protein ComEC
MVLALWNMIFYSSRTRRAFVVQIAIVITIWLYAVLVGLEPSAVRAAIVASLAMFSGRFGRRADPLTILILTTGGMVLWNPNYTQMVGFWLSVVASFAIISRMPGTGKVTLRLAMKRIAQGVLLAQAATMPLVMMTFGTWSFSSILANLLIQPSMTLAFPLTFVLAVIVLIVPTLAPVVAWVPALLLDFVLTVVTRLSPLGSPIQQA